MMFSGGKKWNRKKGGEGERVAGEFLEKKGHGTVERNWGNRFGEIDLICVDGDVLVFVEVKMKTGDGFGRPEEMINRKKLGQVRRMAEVYLTEKGLRKRYTSLRIDVVCVSKIGGKCEVRHYENVEL